MLNFLHLKLILSHKYLTRRTSQCSHLHFLWKWVFVGACMCVCVCVGRFACLPPPLLWSHSSLLSELRGLLREQSASSLPRPILERESALSHPFEPRSLSLTLSPNTKLKAEICVSPATTATDWTHLNSFIFIKILYLRIYKVKICFSWSNKKQKQCNWPNW